MNGQSEGERDDIAGKIARLVEERGWTQERFAELTKLNRHTVRRILQGSGRCHAGTLSACARALGLSVDELRCVPVDVLMRWRAGQAGHQPQRLYELATQPEFLAWVEKHPERARELRPDEVDEVLSVQATGGPLTASGVEQFMQLLERKRRLLAQVHAIAGTEYLDLLEQFVSVLFDKVRPYPDRQ